MKFLTFFQSLLLVSKHHEEETPVCEIESDYSSIEGILRTKIFKADTKFAAKILTLDKTFGLGAGLTYLDNQTCGVIRSDNRRADPDIVAIQVQKASFVFEKVPRFKGDCIECEIHGSN